MLRHDDPKGIPMAINLAYDEPTAPAFYTVAEAARILRVDPATIYRAIRANEFPAVRIRARYVIPADAVRRLAGDATRTGTRVDAAQLGATAGSTA
jgi:excisionase family DNA binding protein